MESKMVFFRGSDEERGVIVFLGEGLVKDMVLKNGGCFFKVCQQKKVPTTNHTPLRIRLLIWIQFGLGYVGVFMLPRQSVLHWFEAKEL